MMGVRYNIACPACKRPVAGDALQCPHCGKEFDPAQVNARNTFVRRASFGCGLLFIVVAVLFLIFVITTDPEKINEPVAEAPTPEPTVAIPVTNEKQAALPEPDLARYPVRKADLYRDKPNDHCRSLDAKFIEKLMGRAVDAAPIDIRPSMSFEDFNVVPASGKPGFEAILRFKAPFEGEAATMFYAHGDIDPRNCQISAMQAGVGASPYSPVSKPLFEIP